MIVDSSAIFAVLEGEPEAERVLQLAASSRCRMSVATWLECCIVADRRSLDHGRRLDELLAALDIELVEVTQRQAALARVAHRRFGRGSGSAARLNYGDCFAYALAADVGEPLLFVGDDFAQSDVRPALS